MLNLSYGPCVEWNSNVSEEIWLTERFIKSHYVLNVLVRWVKWSTFSRSAQRCLLCVLPAWSLLLWLRSLSRRSHWNLAALVQRRRKSGMLGKYLLEETKWLPLLQVNTFMNVLFSCSIIEKGEENCTVLIEAHKDCMRALGFKI